ncbi:MAG TPA: transcription-repair coupling factor [Tepidisphaeraceae bacterium]|nr:transcription-repair coupling factor [Tepidisphaeraceae bacterium]
MVATHSPGKLGRLVAARPLKDLARRLDEMRAATASGLWGSSVAAVVAGVRAELRRPILVICGHLDEADDLADDIELFAGRRPDVLPALELGGNLGKLSEEQVVNRMSLVSRIANGIGNDAMLVAPVQAVMQSVPSKQQLKQLMLDLKPGDDLEPEKLIVWLAEHGYNRLDQVEVPGDFAVRGGIVDVYLPGDFEGAGEQVGLTARLDFFGDQIESIKQFDPDTMGSLQTLTTLRIVDIKGQLPETGESVSLLHYLPEQTIVVLWAPLEIGEQARSYLDRLPEAKGIYPLSAILRQAAQFARLELSQFDQGTTAIDSLIGGKEVPQVHLPIRSLQRFETEAKKAITELAELAGTHDVTVFCENAGEAQRFTELLEQAQPGLSKKVQVPIGYLHRGFVWDEGERQRVEGTDGRHEDSESASASSIAPDSDRDAAASSARPLALLGHHELFHRYEQRRRVKKIIAGRPVDSFLDLKDGDYVVHVAHGIARFMGMKTISKDGTSEEYLTLRFAESATLHVPAARINLIQKYVGGFGGHPQLSRLGTGAWEKQKAKVAEAVMDMAAELLEIQAARAAEAGTPYPPDTEWQREFEAEFPYEPTPDQVTSADEIKKDMQKSRPMDRLLCGDVGYGKTEMAMRAAFKAVEYGKQVAILVPTTVLAEQHYRSFKERMVNYPFEVDSISRFRSGREQKETVSRLAKGEIDILIGTHRLLSKDIKFSDLGLVVIDEEQRFGVTHKERLKQMRKMVDVLTMSATPIPRTLHMGMVGLRDISSLTTAPRDRRSVVTEVMSFDRQRVKAAILRELNRDGQIYFVHNRVQNILEMADEIQQMVPDARILVGHGQMGDSGELEEVMLKFIRHEADILVCTTIIESGLDIPNANTIVINNADRFGLSELHQLRGRVGRWKHRAYCYLLLPADRPVTPIAAKRLKAIEEYSHLGAGFKIAMRDLELRGAGNILGPEQSGHIASVGYEMYCQLLEEATRELKKEAKATTPEAHVDIGISAFLPKTYISGDRQRMDLYRRLTRCTSLDMLQMLEQDMKDAFGEPPRQAIILFALTEVRLLAQMYGINSIIRKPPDVVMTVTDAAKAQTALAGAPGTLRVIDEKTIYLRMPGTFVEPEPCLMVLRNLMRQAHDKQKNMPAVPAPATAQTGGGLAAAQPTAMSASRSPDVAPSKPQKIPPPAPPDAKEAARVKAAQAASAKASEAARQRFQAASEPPKPAAPQSAKPGRSIHTELQKLASLRDQGILTQEEFQNAKQRLMAGI